MKKKIKDIARDCIYPLSIYAGIDRVLLNLSRKQHLILNYHGVVKKADYNLSVNHMSLDVFESQIKYFSKNYNILTPEEFHTSIKQNRRAEKKNLLLTFDDGYENNYTNALPVLLKYNAPAIIFPVTGLIGTSKPTWYDCIDLTKCLFVSNSNKEKLYALSKKHNVNSERNANFSTLKSALKQLNPHQKDLFFEDFFNLFPDAMTLIKSHPEFWKILSIEQITEMQNTKMIYFGSHTVNHPNLGLLETSTAKEEIEVSKYNLESITGREVKYIAFPDGSYNEKTKELAKKAGYEYLYAVNFQCKSDLNDNFIFERLSISNTTTPEAMQLYTSIKFMSRIAY